MEPRIQYAQTKDGVSIAYATMGDGMPFVEMPVIPANNVQRLSSDVRSWFDHLTQKRKLVRYDSRGTGLSQRNVTDFSLDSLVLDLEAVVNHLGLERCALFAPLYSGPVAIRYATRHPERVSHLILWHSWARTRDAASPKLRALGRLLDSDWETYTETAAHVALGWSEGEQARKAAESYRESITQESLSALLRAMREVDVTDLLPQVRSPTLVLHRRHIAWPQPDLATGLASRIPGARLVFQEGGSAMHDLGDTRPALKAIDEFLGEGEEAAAGAEPPEPSAFRTVLFTDVEGSTALTDRLGDARARELLRQHERMVREALKAHGGSEVKALGDGFMTSFSSATKALECAIAMQRAFAAHNESAPEPIRVRIGLNAGEPIAEDEDLYGTAVNEAARITATAMGGEILVSNVVRELAKGKDFVFSDRGETSLKGFEEPVRLYEVRWREGG